MANGLITLDGRGWPDRLVRLAIGAGESFGGVECDVELEGNDSAPNGLVGEAGPGDELDEVVRSRLKKVAEKAGF